jgi:hypothetical protein
VTAQVWNAQQGTNEDNRKVDPLCSIYNRDSAAAAASAGKAKEIGLAVSCGYMH